MKGEVIGIYYTGEKGIGYFELLDECEKHQIYPIPNAEENEVAFLAVASEPDAAARVVRREELRTFSQQQEPHDATPEQLQGVEQYSLYARPALPYAVLISSQFTESIPDEILDNREALEQFLNAQAPFKRIHVQILDANYAASIFHPIFRDEDFPQVLAQLQYIRRGKDHDEYADTPLTPTSRKVLQPV